MMVHRKVWNMLSSGKSVGLCPLATGPVWARAAAVITGPLPWLLGPRPCFRSWSWRMPLSYSPCHSAFISPPQGPQPHSENSAQGWGPVTSYWIPPLFSASLPTLLGRSLHRLLVIPWDTLVSFMLSVLTMHSSARMTYNLHNSQLS